MVRDTASILGVRIKFLQLPQVEAPNVQTIVSCFVNKDILEFVHPQTRQFITLLNLLKKKFGAVRTFKKIKMTKSFLFNNQPDALINQIYCHKTLHISGIFSAHHQEFSTVHTCTAFHPDSAWILSSQTRMKLTSAE